MPFPLTRMRRWRRTPALRRLVRETRLQADDLAYPLFVCPGTGVRAEVLSLPGVFQLSVDQAVEESRAAHEEGIPAVLLFGIPERKDLEGSESWSPEGAVQRAARALKKEAPDLVVMTDVCLCEYTSHGHCGKVVGGEVDNDATLPLLARAALSHAEAGADVVAPSDMMDGRVAAIRRALDDQGFTAVAILSYAAKFASAFYGPFREAAGSAPQFGDRRAYQMDPGNAREALREVLLDVEEGADAVMVKPALPGLDIIRAVREEVPLPLFAYHTSGEYAMVRAAGRLGWVEEERAMMEVLLAIRRAGADVIVTYFAREAARLLGQRGGGAP